MKARDKELLQHYFHCPSCNSFVQFTVEDLTHDEKTLICPSCGLHINIDHRQASKDIIDKINKLKSYD